MLVINVNNAALYSQDQEQVMWENEDDLKEPPSPSNLCTSQAECHSLSSSALSPWTGSCRRGQEHRGCIWIKVSQVKSSNMGQVISTHIPMMQRQQQRAQARVLGPDLVLVLTWCWHEWHVRSTWHRETNITFEHFDFSVFFKLLNLLVHHWAGWERQVGLQLPGELCARAQHLECKSLHG